LYLSWLGADPRDGSPREPSALVSELLAAAGAYHAQPAEAARQLMLRHPLQPFSPAAFGQGDARGFSYRGQWHPAAGRLSGARDALPPWMPVAQTLADAEQGESELPIEALRRFLLAPTDAFLRHRLGLRLAEVAAAGEDLEPLHAPTHGRERAALQRAVFDGLLEGRDAATLYPLLRARALLPSGPPGTRALDQILRDTLPYAQAFAQWRGDGATTSQPLPLEVQIDGLRLHGRLAHVWPRGIARLRFGTPNGPSHIRNGLDWLLATAAGIDLPFVEVQDDPDAGIDAHARRRIPREQAIDALRTLLGLRREGLRRPLPFAPYSGWAFQSAADPQRGAVAAAARWRGSERQWAEGDAEAIRIALRGRDPFADAEAFADFAELTGTVFGAVMAGLPATRDIHGIALPDADPGDEA
jgi:exodeoxyribonuclease V gamma subunit